MVRAENGKGGPYVQILLGDATEALSPSMFIEEEKPVTITPREKAKIALTDGWNVLVEEIEALRSSAQTEEAVAEFRAAVEEMRAQSADWLNSVDEELPILREKVDRIVGKLQKISQSEEKEKLERALQDFLSKIRVVCSENEPPENDD